MRGVDSDHVAVAFDETCSASTVDALLDAFGVDADAAELVAAALRPGGRLVLIDYHPVLYMFDRRGELQNPYSSRPTSTKEGQILEKFLFFLGREIVDCECCQPPSASAAVFCWKQVSGLFHQGFVRHDVDFRETVKHIG